MNDLIDPIEWFPEYSCSKCHGHMNILTTERSLIVIDEEGHPYRSGSLTRIEAVCPDCGHTEPYNYNPVTMTYYPDTPWNNIMAQMDMENYQKQIAARSYDISCLVENEDSKSS